MSADAPENKAVEAMVAAGNAATEAARQQSRPCPRCEGRSYHHGFGERGHDPDWCIACGGSGNEPIHDHGTIAAIGMRASLLALAENVTEEMVERGREAALGASGAPLPDREDLARAAENDALERAAKVAMDYAFDESWQHSNKAVQANASQNIAAAIRALKQPETKG